MASATDSDPGSGSVVIVGAGIAGTTAATQLRALGFAGAVHLVDADPHLPYDRPPLSKELLAGTKEPEAVRLYPAEYYDEHAISLHLGPQCRVTAVTHGEAGFDVVTDGGDVLAATHVVLATGGPARHLRIPGAELDGVHVLRSMADVTAIRAELPDVRRAVIVGAGFIGLEAAAALTQCGVAVTVLETLAEPLERVVGPEVGAMLAAAHRARGVDIRCDTTVTAFEAGTDGRVAAVRTFDDTVFDADLVIVGIGMVPTTELAESVGCVVDDGAGGGGIVVDEQCRTTVDGVWAAGDIARFPWGGHLLRVEHWAVASDHGAVVARSICDAVAQPFGVPWFWSDQFDLKLQYAGHAVRWDDIVVRGGATTPGEESFCAFYVSEGVVTAGLAVNRPRDFRGLRDVLAAGVALPPDVAMDESVDLRAFARGR